MNWTAQTSGTIAELNDVSFADARNGWAVGEGGLILHTSDGGNVWDARHNGTTQTFTAVSFPTPNFGCAVGYNGTIITTTNGGQTWSLTTYYVGGNMANLFDVHFIDPNNGWACGAHGIIIATVDGGNNWRVLSNPIRNQVETIHFVDATNGWAAGADGAIIATSNGGLTWTSQTSGSIQDIVGITFSDRQHGWAVDLGGNALGTGDGGKTWRIMRSPPASESQVLLAIDAVGNEHCCAVGRPGLILSSDNAGATWATDHVGTISSLNAVDFIDADHGWAVGSAGNILSSQPSQSGAVPGFGAVWTHEVAIDPMSLVLPPHIYVKWAEGHWPHNPKQLERFLDGLAPIDRRAIQTRATELREFAEVLAKVATEARF